MTSRGNQTTIWSERFSCLVATRPFSFSVAVVAVVAAFYLQQWLQAYITNHAHFLLLYPAVMLAALYGGFLPGMLATVLAAMLVSYLQMSPEGSILIENPSHLLMLAVFVVASGLNSAIAGAIRGYQNRVREAEIQLQVTRQKNESSETIRRQEELLRVAFDKGNVPTCLADVNLKFQRVNSALCRMLGYTETEMLKKSCLEITAPEDRQEFARGINALVEGSIPAFRMDKRYLKHDGSVVWGDMSVACVRDNAENPVYLVTHIQNITRRKTAEKQLQAVNQLLTNHLENTPLAVIELDADLRFVRWAGTAEEQFGWRGEEVLGKHVDELRWIHEEDRDLLARVEHDVKERRAARRFSANRHYHRDGSVRFFEWYISALVDDSGRVTSVLCLGQDVTDRKHLEQVMHHMNLSLEQRVAEQDGAIHELDSLLLQQSRLAAMGEMINSIAHQWRQPLNVLGLHLQKLLFQDADEPVQAKIEAGVAEAMSLIEHMSRTIDDFRNFFKPDKEKQYFSLARVVSQTLKLVQDTFNHHEIAVCVNVADARILGYPNEFSQALLNILENARDVLLERRVTSGQVTIASENREGVAVISVEDNAGGIADDILDRIFEPYFSTKGVQGTGIGLYMSKKIIETNMGGSIAVRNVPAGAAFTILIPESNPGADSGTGPGCPA